MTTQISRLPARRLATGSLLALTALATIASFDRDAAAGYLPVEGARRMLSNGGLPPAPHARFGFAALPLAQAALDDFVSRRRLAALESDIIAVGVIARALEQQHSVDATAVEAAAVAELRRIAPSIVFPSSPPEFTLEIAPAEIANARAAIPHPIETASTVSAAVPSPVPGQVPAVAAARITSTDAAAQPVVSPQPAAADARPAKRTQAESGDDAPRRAAPAPRKQAVKPSAQPSAQPSAGSDTRWTRGVHDQSGG